MIFVSGLLMKFQMDSRERLFNSVFNKKDGTREGSSTQRERPRLPDRERRRLLELLEGGGDGGVDRRALPRSLTSY